MSLTSLISCASDNVFYPVFFNIYILSLDESYLLDDESDKIGSDLGSFGTYSFHAFSLRFEVSVVGVLGSGIFAPTGVGSKGGRILVFYK